MPGGLHFADQALPRVMQGWTAEEKLESILSFLYQLTDQLRYIFENTELEQFTSTALEKKIDSQLREVVESQQEETRLYVKNGDYFSFREKEIYYVSSNTQQLTLISNKKN